MSMHNIAVNYGALGQHADALRLCEEALALRKGALGPDHPDSFRSRWLMAESLVKLDRGAEAVQVIDECFERAPGKVLPPRLLPRLLVLRLRYFENRKDAAGCRRTAELWENLKRTDALGLYNAACLRAATAAVIRATDNSPASRQLADAEADRAMVWLNQAIAAGFKNAAYLKRDRDLNALRDRADFAKLVTRLEAIRD